MYESRQYRVPDLIPKYRKTEFLKKAQQGKIENVAGSV
jgi:hypothetical protein